MEVNYMSAAATLMVFKTFSTARINRSHVTVILLFATRRQSLIAFKEESWQRDNSFDLNWTLGFLFPLFHARNVKISVRHGYTDKNRMKIYAHDNNLTTVFILLIVLKQKPKANNVSLTRQLFRLDSTLLSPMGNILSWAKDYSAART